MSKVQTRRSVSLNRSLYDAATAFAAERQITLAQLVADSLRAQGVSAPEQRHVPRATAVQSVARTTRSARVAVISSREVLRRIAGADKIPRVSKYPPAVESRGGGEVCARGEAGTPPNTAPEQPKRYTAISYRPSLERQMLGDFTGVR
jgi:hypothetical protein